MACRCRCLSVEAKWRSALVEVSGWVFPEPHLNGRNSCSLGNVTIYKWKNHFSEMKGDVGMSLHEKEGEQEDA